MIAGLLAAAVALLAWPTPFERPAPRTGADGRPRLRHRLDSAMPQLLGVVVAALLASSNRSPAGVAVAAGLGIGAGFALRVARARAAAAVRPDRALPLTLTVAGLLLRTGTPPQTALAAAARTCGSAFAAECAVVERRIAMGDNAAEAWAGLLTTPQLAAVGSAASRTSDSGAALAQAWETSAQQARADQRLAGEVAARKVGISALAPLGLCFLPSFVCLGVVPIVIGLAGDIL